MSWTPPTPADLKGVFPSFAATPDTVVAYWLTRAARIVDASWPDEDGPHAQMVLAAHYLTQQGIGTSAEAQAFASGASRFKRIRSGAFDLDQFDWSKEDELSSTLYGRQFKEILRSVKGGPRVSSSGAIPYYGGRFGFGPFPGW